MGVTCAADLPTEILDRIYWFLPFDDVCSVRLVSKRYGEVGERHLFSNCKIRLSRSSLQKLNKIAQHPNFHRHVRALAYNFEIFEEIYPDYNSWRAHVELSRPEIFRHLVARGTCAETYGLYRQLADEQDELMLNEQDIRNIGQAVRCLSGLQKICMWTSSDYEESSGESIPPVLVERLHGETGRHGPQGERPLRSLLASLEGSGIQIRKLRAAFVSFNMFKRPAPIAALLSKVCTALTSLKLRVATYTMTPDLTDYVFQTDECREVLGNGVLRDVLQRITNLQSLEVAICGRSNTPPAAGPARLESVFSLDHSWPQLRKLKLMSFDTTEHFLFQLLSNHASLTFLGLYEIALTAGRSWMTLLPKIQTILHLERARFGGAIWDPPGPSHAPPDHWDVGWLQETAPPSISELREKLEYYMVHGGEPPFNIANMG